MEVSQLQAAVCFTQLNVLKCYFSKIIQCAYVAYLPRPGHIFSEVEELTRGVYYTKIRGYVCPLLHRL